MEIKEYLKNVLSDSEIVSLTGDQKIHFLHADQPIAPYIEYEIYDEAGAQWEENIEIATDYYIQIDIFSQDDYTELENKIREKMRTAGFARTSAVDLFEESMMYYHKAMRFIYTQERMD